MGGQIARAYVAREKTGIRIDNRLGARYEDARSTPADILRLIAPRIPRSAAPAQPGPIA
ncbi:MAG: hypothetical protein NTU94_10025 [Planctomycetota bacterium]|nr:hypothetical protein [Planctomycetota bacterium]